MSTPVPETKAFAEAMSSLRRMMALHSRDWSEHANDAWMYGILLGWGGDPDDPDSEGAWAELADRHGWDAVALARLQAFHIAVAEALSEGGSGG